MFSRFSNGQIHGYYTTNPRIDDAHVDNRKTPKMPRPSPKTGPWGDVGRSNLPTFPVAPPTTSGSARKREKRGRFDLPRFSRGLQTDFIKEFFVRKIENIADKLVVHSETVQKLF